MAGAVENVDGVWQKVGDGVKGFGGPLRTSRQIDDDCFAADYTDGAGKNCGRRFFEAFAAHFFGDAGNDAVGDAFSRLRSVIAGADASAAGGEYDVDAA